MALTKTESILQKVMCEVGLESFSDDEKRILIDIVQDESCDYMSTATDMLNVLGVEVWKHRRAIIKILVEYDEE